MNSLTRQPDNLWLSARQKYPRVGKMTLYAALRWRHQWASWRHKWPMTRCLFNGLFRQTTTKISKLGVTCLSWEQSTGGRFRSQRTSNYAECVSMMRYARLILYREDLQCGNSSHVVTLWKQNGLFEVCWYRFMVLLPMTILSMIIISSVSEGSEEILISCRSRPPPAELPTDCRSPTIAHRI